MHDIRLELDSHCMSSCVCDFRRLGEKCAILQFSFKFRGGTLCGQFTICLGSITCGRSMSYVYR